VKDLREEGEGGGLLLSDVPFVVVVGVAAPFSACGATIVDTVGLGYLDKGEKGQQGEAMRCEMS